MFRKTPKEDKAKLEHKLYLARESPEPNFDLSDCQIRNVPQGIYSLCRVFRKESLHLQNNCLNSLQGGGDLKDLANITVLDISGNVFTTLPEDLQYCTSIKELNVSRNNLKQLPNSICNLRQLEMLDVSQNALICLPNIIGELRNLIMLNIKGNRKLKNIPISFYSLTKLQILEIDEEGFKYPPKEIMEGGNKVNCIREFICQEQGFDFMVDAATADVPDKVDISPRKMSSKDDQRLIDKIWGIENMKMRKTEEFLEIERQNMVQQQQELELALNSKMDREKLLSDITNQQNEFDMELSKLQQVKEIERNNLIKQIEEEENKVNIAVQNLLTLNNTSLAALVAEEQLQEEAILTSVSKYNQTLRKSEILNAMEEILTLETEKFKEMDQSRQQNAQNILEQEQQCDEHLRILLTDLTADRDELQDRLMADNDLQRSAVQALLVRADMRTWALVQQVRLVEQQLTVLTGLELERKRLQVDQQLNDLSEQRINLSILLMELLEQQNQRRTHLLSTLRTIEDSYDTAEDFWLRKYQQLLETLPLEMMEAQRNIDPLLAESLLMLGVIHCLPFLARILLKQEFLSDITEDTLESFGIKSSSDRNNILEAFKLYYKQTQMEQPSVSPSAPKLCLNEEVISEEAATAPPLVEMEDNNGKRVESTTECVICMDHTCEVIFVPCGHFCCCVSCSSSSAILECPMCRATIERKIKVHL